MVTITAELQKELCRGAIVLEQGDEPYYDSITHMYGTAKTPMVSLQIAATNTLVMIADRLRNDMGYKPMLPLDGDATNEDYDMDGWYDFYYEITYSTKSRLGENIFFYVVNSDSEDNEEEYCIEVNEETQLEIKSILDEQLKYEYGITCEEMLKEAAEYLNEYE